MNYTLRNVFYKNMHMFQAGHTLQGAPVLEPYHLLARLGPLPLQPVNESLLHEILNQLFRLRRHQAGLLVRRYPRF